MAVIKTPAVILHGFAYGDSSKILRILTPEYGLRSVMARGARSPRSRLGAILEPFVEGEAQFNLREGRDLFTLSSFSLVRSRRGIGRNLSAFAGASLLCEIALRTGTEEPDPLLFDFVRSALDSLSESLEAPEATALRLVWKMVGIVGFQPEMANCLRCGRELGPEEAARVDIQAGGVVCVSCRTTGRILPSAVRNQIGAMTRGMETPVEPADLDVHGALLEAFLPVHMSPDRGLKSLAMFREELKTAGPNYDSGAASSNSG